MPKPFFITTPIYYVNDRPHIGHAYTSIACDVLARYMRLSGHPTKFLTGTDEHGQKVEKSAVAAGIVPKEFVDKVSVYFREMAKALNISNDDFIRTTEPRHVKSSQELWKRMQERGHIYADSYKGWYAVRDEAYYQESELVDGKAPTGADVEWVEEPSYFFDLSKWQDDLLKLYEGKYRAKDGKTYGLSILPESRRNEVISFVKGGLKDLSISRTTFKWGIPVPGDEKHVMYVWLDALANYLSALGYPDINAADFKTFWPASLHMVGKDILRFHTVYWPAFLMAADLPPPQRVFAHGWWTNEGQKISKSLGNVIDPFELIQQYGLDQIRYFLLREVPFGSDGDFSRERVKIVINTELANNLGNLVQRTLSMIHKHCGGLVPDPSGVKAEDIDMEFLERVHVTKPETPEETAERYYACRFSDLAGDILEIARQANAYIDTKAPWTQKKTDERAMHATLYYLAEGIRCIAIMLQPFMPASAARMLTLLGYEAGKAEQGVSFEELRPEYRLKPGAKLLEPQPLFPRIEA